MLYLDGKVGPTFHNCYIGLTGLPIPCIKVILLLIKNESMKNAYVDKAEANKEMIEAKIKELQAKMKDVAADARINIQRKIEELRKDMNGLTK